MISQKSSNKARRVLVTGPTGNVGGAVLSWLSQLQPQLDVVAGLRSVDGTGEQIEGASELRKLDFLDATTYTSALTGIDTLFLIRPPAIAKVKEVFEPFLRRAKELGLARVVLLSVQGADKNAWVPHAKMEKLIMELGFKYVFLRPSYFMQNITADLLPDIRKSSAIRLPAGKARFLWVDARDVGEVGAHVIASFSSHQNKALDITGVEKLNFYEAADELSQCMGREIRYKSQDLITFFIIKKRQGLPFSKILVMGVLHLLPRFQAEPELSETYQKITGKQSTSLKEFCQRNKKKLKTA